MQCSVQKPLCFHQHSQSLCLVANRKRRVKPVINYINISAGQSRHGAHGAVAPVQGSQCSGTGHTYVLDADCQLCLEVAEVLCKLITVVVEGEEPLQKGQQLRWGKTDRDGQYRPRAAFRAPAAEGSIPAAPKAEGPAGSPEKDALFLVSLSKPPLSRPQSQVCASFPQSHVKPLPTSVSFPCITPAPWSLTAELGGAEQSRQHGAIPCTAPLTAPSYSALSRNYLCRSWEIGHFPKEL